VGVCVGVRVGVVVRDVVEITCTGDLTGVRSGESVLSIESIPAIAILTF